MRIRDRPAAVQPPPAAPATADSDLARVRQLIRVVIGVAALALGLGLVLTWRLGGGAAWSLTLLGRLPALLALGAFSQTGRFFRWHFLVRRRARRLHLRDSMRIYLSGFALEMTPGRVGAFLKFSLLRQTTGVPETETVGVLPVEAATEVVSFLLVALAGALLGGYRLPTIGGGVFVAGAALIALALFSLLYRPMSGRRSPILRRMPLVRSFLRGLLTIGGPLPLLIALGCALAARASEVLLFWIAAGAVGLRLSVAGAVLAWGASGLAGGLSLLPGGVGAAEGAIVAAVADIGGAATLALAAALVSRIMTIWLWVPVGLACAVVSTRDTPSAPPAAVPQRALP